MMYLQFFTKTLEIAAFLHAIRIPYAEAAGINSRLDTLKWVAHQVRDYLQDANWKHADFVDNISVATRGTSQRVG